MLCINSWLGLTLFFFLSHLYHFFSTRWTSVQEPRLLSRALTRGSTTALMMKMMTLSKISLSIMFLFSLFLSFTFCLSYFYPLHFSFSPKISSMNVDSDDENLNSGIKAEINKCKIFIGNLPFTAVKEDVEALFKPVSTAFIIHFIFSFSLIQSLSYSS